MKYYPDKAIPPGPALAADMTDIESKITSKHVAYRDGPAGEGRRGGVRPGRRPIGPVWHPR
jgi:hypothetical protein